MSDPFTLTSSYVLLCEGLADQAFLKELIIDRKLPKFDMLPHDKFYGVTSIGKMLQALRGDPIGFAAIKGILIIVDSSSNPTQTLELVREQINKVEGVPCPDKYSTIVKNGDGLSVMIKALPDENTPGALETLYVRERYHREPWMKPCVEKFLSCEHIEALTWSAEKRDKAHFHSIVAARCRDDPSRSASSVFRKPCVIDISSSCFDFIAHDIKLFCKDALAEK